MKGYLHQPKYNLGQSVWFVRNGGVFPVMITKVVSELRNDKSITDYYHLEPLTPFVGSLEGSYDNCLGLTPEEALIKTYDNRYLRDGIKTAAPTSAEKPPFHPIQKTIQAMRQRTVDESADLGFSPA